MSVVVVRRRLFLCVVVGILVAAYLPASAQSEADPVARAQELMADRKYDEAIGILLPLTSAAEPTAKGAKYALQNC